MPPHVALLVLAIGGGSAGSQGRKKGRGDALLASWHPSKWWGVSIVVLSPWPWACLHQMVHAAWREGEFYLKNRSKIINMVTGAMAMLIECSAVIFLQELELSLKLWA